MGGNESGECLCLLRLRQGVPPGEGNLVLVGLNVEPVRAQRLSDEAGLAVHQLVQAVKGVGAETVQRKADGQGVLTNLWYFLRPA